MQPIPNFPDQPPPGLTSAVEAVGIVLVCERGTWMASDPVQAEAIAAAYDPTEHVKIEKRAELADLRWQKETGGFMFQPAGAPRAYRFVSTREAMGPVMGAVLAVQVGAFLDPTLWKTAEGEFVPIAATDVVPLFKAFAAHVSASFAEEADKENQIKAATWEDAASITIEAAPAEKK